MLHILRSAKTQRHVKALQSLLGYSQHNVQRDIVKAAGFRLFHRMLYVIGIMSAAEYPQLVIVYALHTDR